MTHLLRDRMRGRMRGRRGLVTSGAALALAVGLTLPLVASAGAGSTSTSATSTVLLSQGRPVTASSRETAAPAPANAAAGPGLRDPAAKDVAMQLVSSAENSSRDWRAQYAYVEDIGDGRGYTAGIIGFCSGTGDLLDVITRYVALAPRNPLARYLPALHRVNGTASHAGLDPGFPAAWRSAAGDPLFRRAQDEERDAVYFDPAVTRAEQDGLQALGQFIYYDAMVMHGPGTDPLSFGGIRNAAMRAARTPAQGGDEVAYLSAFLDARRTAMRAEAAHSDTSRVDTAQLVFLRAGNLALRPPLRWAMYGEPFSIP